MTATHERPIPLSTRAELDDLVASHDRVLVEFYTEGCGKCAAMEPVLGGVARSTEAVVATINPRDDPELVDEYDVQSVPKLLLFVDGELAETRADGLVSVEELRAFVTAAD